MQPEDKTETSEQIWGEAKKKWSKGRARDKLNNLVLLDKATYDQLCKEVPNSKLIAPAAVSERLKIRGSLARAALQGPLGKDLVNEFQSRAHVVHARNTKVGMPQLL